MPLRLLVVAVLVLVGIVATSAPAWADFNEGGGTGGTGGGTPLPPGTTVCHTSTMTGHMAGSGNQVFNAPFFKCFGPPATGQNGTFICQTGYEVWRFYGTKSNNRHVLAGTVSRINIADLCSTNRNTRRGVAPVPHPDDAGLPASYNRSFSNDRVRTVGEFGSTGWPIRWAQGTSRNGHKVSYSTMHGIHDTIRPFRSVGSYTCAQLQGSDPFARYFSASASAEQRSYVTNALWDVMTFWLRDASDIDQDGNTTELDGDPWQRNGRWGLALASINARAAIGAPWAAANITYGDGLNCSSSLDFTADAGDPPVSSVVCMVPVVGLLSRYHASSNGLDYFAVRTLGGERYANERGVQSGFAQYRQAIYNDRMSRPGPGEPFANPGNPTASANRVNRQQVGNAAAARAARDYATCGEGTSMDMTTFADAPSYPTPDPVELTVDRPDALRVGGAYRPETITVTVGDLTCDGGQSCGGEASIGTLDFDVVLEPVRRVGNTWVPDGTWTACRSAGQTNCNYRIVSRQESVASGVKTGEVITVELYRASKVDGSFQVRLTNLSGTINRTGTQATCYLFQGNISWSSATRNAATGNVGEFCDEPVNVTDTVPVSFGPFGTHVMPVVGANIDPR